ELSLTVVATAWEGLGRGHGHLRARRATVEAGGRRGADRPRRAELWLPGPGGTLAAAPPAPVEALRRPGAPGDLRRAQPPRRWAGAHDVAEGARPSPTPAGQGSCA